MKIRDRIKELRRVEAGLLLPNPKNWRRHPKEQADALRGLLAEVGYADALLARETPKGLMLIDGHLRVETTPNAEVPVLILDLNEEEADKLLLTLDPLAMMATADADATKALLATVSSDNEAVTALLGRVKADAEATAALLAHLSGEASEDPGPKVDKAAELQAKWGTKRGQLWKIGTHRLFCGDCLLERDRKALLGDGTLECVFTSPPYAVGVDYGPEYLDSIENLRAMLPQLAASWFEMLPAGGFAVINFGDLINGRGPAQSEGPCEYPMSIEYFPVFRASGWILWSRRVWCKPAARVSSQWCIGTNRSAANYEHVWTWLKPGEKPLVGRVLDPEDSQHGWFDTSSDAGVDVGKEVHGAGMAVGCARRMIATHSNLGAGVFEPFCGTGTTLVACEQLGRKCYAMDVSPGYVAVTLERLADMGLKPEKVRSK